MRATGGCADTLASGGGVAVLGRGKVTDVRLRCETRSLIDTSCLRLASASSRPLIFPLSLTTSCVRVANSLLSVENSSSSVETWDWRAPWDSVMVIISALTAAKRSAIETKGQCVLVVVDVKGSEGDDGDWI